MGLEEEVEVVEGGGKMVILGEGFEEGVPENERGGGEGGEGEG